jgi:transposase InsO family protein
VRFAFIRDHIRQFPVDLMCQVLEVSRSGYYAWRHRAPSRCAERQTNLVEQIRDAYAASRCNYGSPRVTVELAARGVACSRNTVAKLMRKHGIRSRTKRRFVVRTTDSRHGHPVAENRLNRQFARPLPNQAWAADITYIPTQEGWLYLAVVIDLCSRKVIGWSTADHLRAELVCKALEMAITHRKPSGQVLHHSDRGVQYACDEYQQLLSRHGMLPSMSRTGNCYDNAVVESFFGKLKTELIHHTTYAKRAEAHLALFDHIEIYYNRQRRHSTLGYKTPAEFEASLN